MPKKDNCRCRNSGVILFTHDGSSPVLAAHNPVKRTTCKKRGKKRAPQTNLSGPQPVVPAPWQLQVLFDGVRISFAEYTRKFTRTSYPEYADKTIVIPPLTFYNRKANLKAYRETSGPEDDFANLVLENVNVLNICDADVRGAEAENRVSKKFKDLADREGWKIAIICSAKFENYLNKLDKSVSDVKRPLSRGEHDVLVVHLSYGVLVICVKSVGSDFGELTPEEVEGGERERRLQKKMAEAVSQMEREVANVRHVLSDLSPPISVVLALPCVPRKLAMSVLQSNPDLSKKLETLVLVSISSACLCLDELPSGKEKEYWKKGRSSDDEEAGDVTVGDGTSADLRGRSTPDVLEADRPGAVTADVQSTETRSEETGPEASLTATSEGGLSSWFQRWSQERGITDALTEEQYLEIVGRYCCLYSTVEIPSRSKCEGRIEVRVMPEAVGEVNVRFRALILHKFQTDLLISSSRRVYMHGVMGSGKTVMLMLKAGYWLAQGHSVVIVNVSYDVEGSPIGHALLQAVNERFDDSGISNLAKMVNVKLTEFDPKAFLDNLNSAVPKKKKETTHFCLDEVYPKFKTIFECLTENFPSSEIWAAGLEGEDAPQGFEQVEMTKVLRCPPTIQRVLKANDYSKERIRHYTTCGAQEGLPAEGPEPRFIFHEDHPQLLAGVVSPLQCEACAVEAIEFLQKAVGVVPVRGEGSTLVDTSGSSSLPAAVTTKSATILPATLRIRDVVLLCKDSTSDPIYPKVEDGYKLDTGRFDKFNDMLDQSTFVSTLRQRGYPVRIVRSSSSRELATCEEDAITASWVNPASGLEWAVVIYVPGDPARDQIREPYVGKVKAESSSVHESAEKNKPGQEDRLDADLRRTQVRMTDRDRKYLFWSASRCTAQLVVMVP